MKYCKNCDASMPDDLEFCTKCGAKLKRLIEEDEDVKSTSKTTGAVKPRSWLASFILMLVVGAPLFSVFMSIFLNLPFETVLISVGIPWGIAFAFFMAFIAKGSTIKIQIDNKRDFLDKINTKLSQIGYSLESSKGDVSTYKPSVKAGVLSGKITVDTSQREAVIVGPSMHLRKLKNL